MAVVERLPAEVALPLLPSELVVDPDPLPLVNVNVVVAVSVALRFLSRAQPKARALLNTLRTKFIRVFMGVPLGTGRDGEHARKAEPKTGAYNTLDAKD